MYDIGTRREVHPEVTLQRLDGYWPVAGITRCADVTGLDVLNIPVFAAFTPNNPALQVCWGKGCIATNARVSALMEAVERSHVTAFESDIQNASVTKVRKSGCKVVTPPELQCFHADCYYDLDYTMDWAVAESVEDGETSSCLIPVSAVYAAGQKMHSFTANGLASANSPVEARNHGLYEIIERHVVSSCFNGSGTLMLKHNGTLLVDLEHCTSNLVAALYESVSQAGACLRLFKLPSVMTRVSVFWAVIIDEANPLAYIRANVGYGAHLSAEIAALRAITEAAQSRMVFLHGCREDMAHRMKQPNERNIEKVCKYFSSSFPTIEWEEIDHNYLGKKISNDYDILSHELSTAGFTTILHRELESRIPSISVVKTIVPGTKIKEGIF
ncbi:YcaO-like family protein [Desulfogranum japonicum]|uniref:YcaO-like family protein n=1 Tax=Desulfogranum japonicum TaxID=231447 RepID=UPI00041AD1EE|nr:YcaO-like family protein [Desulfogranum japonicum]